MLLAFFLHKTEEINYIRLHHPGPCEDKHGHRRQKCLAGQIILAHFPLRVYTVSSTFFSVDSRLEGLILRRVLWKRIFPEEVHDNEGDDGQRIWLIPF